MTESDAAFTELPSGLKYREIEPGDGSEKPTKTSLVTVHYEGELEDGEIFDSSLDRGQPATFPLSGVIAGWTEGVQLMSPGARFQFLIPPELAYGEDGFGDVIPPLETLKFEIELLSIG
jgi:FKBP-type peptidyl-prolyl cis-trans isomerase FklB